MGDSRTGNVALVGVGHDVLRGPGSIGGESPLPSGRETAAAAASRHSFSGRSSPEIWVCDSTVPLILIIES